MYDVFFFSYNGDLLTIFCVAFVFSAVTALVNVGDDYFSQQSLRDGCKKS